MLTLNVNKSFRLKFQTLKPACHSFTNRKNIGYHIAPRSYFTGIFELMNTFKIYNFVFSYN
jgi:hypothetical protein